MGYKKVQINPSGGAVKLNITFTGDNVVISYKWNLWETKVNARFYNEDFVGTNLNPHDDSYMLPDPISDNVGRLIIIDFGVVLIDPNASSRKWSISAEVLQDGVSASVCTPEPKVDMAGNHTGGSIYISLK